MKRDDTGQQLNKERQAAQVDLVPVLALLSDLRSNLEWEGEPTYLRWFDERVAEWKVEAGLQ